MAAHDGRPLFGRGLVARGLRGRAGSHDCPRSEHRLRRRQFPPLLHDPLQHPRLPVAGRGRGWNLDSWQRPVPWSNHRVHDDHRTRLRRPAGADRSWRGAARPLGEFRLAVFGPAAVLIPWLLFPPQVSLPRNTVWLWLVFPFVYVVGTFLRRLEADIYPYPFLDPRLPGGFGRAAAYATAVAVVSFFVSTFIKWWSDKRRAAM